ncbi:MAG TPA: hypothetical protein VII94_02130 [Candidatus Saccharimonadales bacterium]
MSETFDEIPFNKVVPTKPEMSAIQRLEVPLPWSPRTRARLVERAYKDAVAEADVDVDSIAQLLGFIDWAKENYIIPGKVAGVLKGLRDYNEHSMPLLFTHNSEREDSVMLQRFEQKWLGLKPADNIDGLWWQKIAITRADLASEEALSALYDRGNAAYPTKTLAALFGLDVSRFEETIRFNEITSRNPSVIKSGNYLIYMFDTKLIEGHICVGDVIKLTKTGVAMLDTILYAFESGEIHGIAETNF